MSADPLGESERAARAGRLNERGNDARERGDLAAAEKAFREAIRLAPAWAAARYNLGLLFKYEGRWAESLAENRRAVELDPADECAWWNLGIAATALGDWTTARDAWRGCGIDVPAGEGPLEMRLGLVPVRLAGHTPEVVWCRRIDPARAIVQNVPLPTSGHVWGDLLLHDGAPNGYRTLQGREVPVFDELEVLQPSGYRTWELELEGADAERLEALERIAEDRGGWAEDWSRTLRWLCRRCSEGHPGEAADHVHDEELRGERSSTGFGVAVRSEEHLAGIVDEWLREAPGCRVRALREVTPTTR